MLDILNSCFDRQMKVCLLSFFLSSFVDLVRYNWHFDVDYKMKGHYIYTLGNDDDPIAFTSFSSFFSLCHCMMIIIVERMRERKRLIDQQEYSWKNKRLIIEYIELKSRCWETKRRKFHTVHRICNLITLWWRRRTR